MLLVSILNFAAQAINQLHYDKNKSIRASNWHYSRDGERKGHFSELARR